MRFTTIITILTMGVVSLGLQAQGEMGVSKYGELTNSAVLRLDKNGAINASYFLSKNGQSIPNSGMLNYSVFSNTSLGETYPSDEFGYGDFTLATNLTSQGTYDPMIILDWIGYSNLSGIVIPNEGDYFALVVSGYFIPKETGVYTFTCEGDDAVDLFINGANVANHYDGHPVDDLGGHTGSIELTAGTKYTFRVRMQEGAGGEGLRVYWKKPSEMESADWHIDPSELFPN